MPFEYTPPKYAQIITELQQRIETGEYPAGSLLPSENQLSAEFGTARPTVVRALRVTVCNESRGSSTSVTVREVKSSAPASRAA